MSFRTAIRPGGPGTTTEGLEKCAAEISGLCRTWYYLL